MLCRLSLFDVILMNCYCFATSLVNRYNRSNMHECEFIDLSFSKFLKNDPIEHRVAYLSFSLCFCFVCVNLEMKGYEFGMVGYFVSTSFLINTDFFP